MFYKYYKIYAPSCPFIKYLCDAHQEKITYVGKINFEFFHKIR